MRPPGTGWGDHFHRRGGRPQRLCRPTLPGGIWRLPFTDGLVDTNLHLLPSFTSGFYHCTDEDCEGAEVFVSRGLGNSPKWAFRLFNRPQVAVITLKKG